MLSAKVLNLHFRRQLLWFYETVKKNSFCTHDVKSKFEIVRDKNFCLGYTYKCNKCKSTCTYSREDYIKDIDLWVPIHIICLNCMNVYRSKLYIPTYHTIFSEWDLTKEIKWIWYHGDSYALCDV